MSATAFLFAYGPEVRAFIASGYLEAIASEGPVIAISTVPESPELSAHGLPIIAIHPYAESYLERKLRTFVSSVVEKRLQLLGASRWRHHETTASGKSRFRDLMKAILSSRLPLTLLVALQRLTGLWGTVDPNLQKAFVENRVRRIFYSAYNDVRTDVVIRTANRAGVRTILIPNSWKDVYVRPRVSPTPSEMFVSDDEACRLFVDLNPDLPRSRVQPHWSLHLAAVLRSKGRIGRREYCERIGIDPAKPFICYTTAAPGAVKGEEFLVKAFAEALESLRPEGTQLIVRLNPMEAGSRFDDILRKIPCATIQRPHWEWLPELDWCAASSEDTSLWAATLEHMHMNVSIPSTVTLEAISFGKQVVNIGFDMQSGLPSHESVSRYWYSSFYRRFQDHPDVRLALNFDDLMGQISAALRGEVNRNDFDSKG